MTEYHVVPDGNLWKLHKGGESLAKMADQSDTIDAGKSMTKAGDTLVIHGSDGKVTDRISY